MKVSRETLIRRLESVTAGLSKRDGPQQSGCYIFKDKKIITYNERVACFVDSPIDITCAVPAQTIRDLLARLSEEFVDIELTEKGLRIRGKNKRATIAIESEIESPVIGVDLPDEDDWQPLHPDFAEAVNVTASCASTDAASGFELTCLHIHPKWVEASDSFQLVRYEVKTDIEEPILIAAAGIKQMTGLGMQEFAVSGPFMHFCNAVGLIFSCLMEEAIYADMTSYFEKAGGDKITLPAGLVEAVEKAQIFSADNAMADQVSISLSDNKLIIKGEGINGWYEEKRRIKYKGAAFSFLIAPKLLATLIDKTTECEIEPGMLKIDAGKFTYLAALAEVDE